MEQIRRLLTSLFDPTWDNLLHLVDIFLVAGVVYQLLKLIRGIRAWRIVVGIIVFVVILGVSGYLHLDALHWLLDKAAILGPVALVILFFPELRQSLENIGGLLPQIVEPTTEARTIEEIIAGVAELAAQSTGALIVVERTSPLNDIVANGVELDAKVSAPLLGAVFFEKNPLHDGAVVVRQDKVIAAACRLPLSESIRLDRHVHMRHRAAVGVTELADCIAIVVSEERGTISLAIDGRLERLPGIQELRNRLNYELRGEEMGASDGSPRAKNRRHRVGIGK